MTTNVQPSGQPAWPTLSGLPTPVKVLLSSILLSLALSMVGALGQVLVHDIIPTFFLADGMPQDSMKTSENGSPKQAKPTGARGDLFGDEAMVPTELQPKSILTNEQFIWTLRWTHIHLFGMCMIFILLGVVTVFLDISVAARNWLIALPFVGVVVDIAAMWLKAFVSPAFFWLHIPGGGLFAGIFVFIFFRAMGEMWSAHDNRSRRSKSN